MKKYDTMWKDLIIRLFNTLKTKNKLYFTIIYYTLD